MKSLRRTLGPALRPLRMRFLIYSLALIVSLGVPSRSSPTLAQATKPQTNPSLKSFVGTWKGECQDKKTYLTLTLRSDGSQLGGTISIGNMHGDPNGQCVEVVDDPTPEHAQTITNAKLQGDTLSFNGAKRDDGTYSLFKMKLVGDNKADLGFMGFHWEIFKQL